MFSITGSFNFSSVGVATPDCSVNFIGFSVIVSIYFSCAEVKITSCSDNSSSFSTIFSVDFSSVGNIDNWLFR